jgi:hypothetical protein
MTKAILLALAAIGLAGCVTTAAHNVDVDDIKSLRIERVDVVLDPAAHIGWKDAQTDYAEARNQQGDSQATADNVGGTPSFRAFVLSRIQSRTKALLEPTLRQTLAGSRPAIARMTVHHVYVPNFLQGLGTGLAFGAGSIQSGMTVSIEFVDSRTNRVVVAYPKTPLVTSGRGRMHQQLLTSPHFSPDPIDRLVAQLQDQLPQWLLKT